MQDLEPFARRLRQACPTLDVALSRGQLVLARGPLEVRLRRGKQISTFDASERTRRREGGITYLDLRTGSLFVDEPGLFLYLRLPPFAGARLSPYQCALLAVLLEGDAGAWFASGISGPQVDLIRLTKLELGIEVPRMAMSRFLRALRWKGIVSEDSREAWRSDRALEALREDFRLSAIGRPADYAGDYREVENRLADRLGERFARGVADVLSKETGAWIEPRDYLVDPSALSEVRGVLGSPIARRYEGAVVTIRPAVRVSLELLTLGRESLRPLLGLTEAMRADSPVARQAGRKAWEKKLRECR